MKKLHLLSRLLLLVALVAGSTSVRAQEILWSEDFSSYKANDVPSGGIYSYICTDGGGNTKIYNENTGGGTAPELLVAKKGSGNNAVGGSFTAVIPLENIEGTLTLKYKQNAQSLQVSTSTDGITGGGTNKTKAEQTVTFEGVTTDMKSITITFTATTTSNVRLDDIILTGYKASSGSGGGETTDPDPGTEPEVKGYYKKITSTDELEDGNYLIVYENGAVALNGVLDANNVDQASNTISVNISNNKQITVTDETKAAEFIFTSMENGYSIQSKSQLYFIYHKGTSNTLDTNSSAQENIISVENGIATIAVDDYKIMYNKTAKQERFRYYKSSSNQEDIQLYKYVETVDVKVSEAGWATWVAPHNVKFAEGEAYTVKVEGDVANLTNVTEIPANTAVVLKGEQGTEVTVTATVTKDEVVLETANDLKASDGEVVGNGKIYVLANKNDQVGFYLLQEESTLPSGKAYLELESNQEVRSFIGLNDNETTGINTAPMQNETKNNVFYNLAGQRVAQPTKGLYIVNGKKLIIK